MAWQVVVQQTWASTTERVLLRGGKKESNDSEYGCIVIGTDHQSGSDSHDPLGEDEVENDTVENKVKGRREMTAKDLGIGDLLNTSMIQNNKILEIAKMLHTMKDAIVLTEDSVDLAIYSRG